MLKHKFTTKNDGVSIKMRKSFEEIDDGIELEDKIEMIKSRKDLIDFIYALQRDLKNNPEEWENITLLDFLDAMSGFVDAIDGFWKNNDIDPKKENKWKMFADILYAAKLHE